MPTRRRSSRTTWTATSRSAAARTASAGADLQPAALRDAAVARSGGSRHSGSSGDVVRALREQTSDRRGPRSAASRRPTASRSSSAFAPGPVAGPSEFDQLIIKSSPDGTLVQLDVDRVRQRRTTARSAVQPEGHDRRQHFQLPAQTHSTSSAWSALLRTSRSRSTRPPLRDRVRPTTAVRGRSTRAGHARRGDRDRHRGHLRVPQGWRARSSRRSRSRSRSSARSSSSRRSGSRSTR